MPISQSDAIGLTCPSCGARFETDAWTLVDAAERSDLAQVLREGGLNLVTCPKCSTQTATNTALLFHDPASRRVYFAVPPDVGEHIWRERAQELLYQLVAGLPEDERRPYLGDVQVEQELDGVRRAVLRNDRRRGATRGGDKQKGRQAEGATEMPSVAAAEPASPTPSSQLPTPDSSLLVDALRALLAADTDAEFNAIVSENPALLDEAADFAVRDLADQAFANGERDVSAALSELRSVLARLRAGGSPVAEGSQQPAALAPQNSELRTQNSKLSDSAYQALLHAASGDMLLAATRDYPALLELWADDDLAARIEAALDERNERLARMIEARREGLAELRAQLSAHAALQHAIQALLAAEGESAVADILGSYPMLLTDTAQDALAILAADAQTRDDPELAGKATSCQVLLRTVRAGLEEQEERSYG